MAGYGGGCDWGWCVVSIGGVVQVQTKRMKSMERAEDKRKDEEG